LATAVLTMGMVAEALTVGFWRGYPNHAQVQRIQIKGHLHEAAPKKQQEQVNSFLIDFDFNISKDVILPESSTLTLLRCTHEEVEDTYHQEPD
jgi:hypothetical protein